MPYSHANRRGITFHLHAGRSALGPAFEFRQSIGDGALDALPEGYEVYEEPNGRLRLVLEADTPLAGTEAAAVRVALESTDYAEYLVEVVEGAVVILQPNWTRAQLARIIGQPVSSLTAEVIRNNTDYAPIMCIEPSAAIDGHFCLLRMEFDPIPGWSEPLVDGPLHVLLAQLEPHLRDA
jgi:hypothetical protein